jgi:hypothetical protein
MADSQSVIPFTSDDHLEAAGLKLLHKAADVAEANSRHSLETALRKPTLGTADSVNIDIVLVFAAFYLRSLRRP